ncbi:uncharacterized protein LOC104876752 [Fukomys damarensis]|uniref:uncharacterized protein LOC104876752 n=1 Tax=Fukomys damarensis TaxID=885580 RepID=UPI000540335F|nr:uncharacterized protein LOC104876752 [Fukomys damarensis]
MQAAHQSLLANMEDGDRHQATTARTHSISHGSVSRGCEERKTTGQLKIARSACGSAVLLSWAAAPPENGAEAEGVEEAQEHCSQRRPEHRLRTDRRLREARPEEDGTQMRDRRRGWSGASSLSCVPDTARSSSEEGSVCDQALGNKAGTAHRRQMDPPMGKVRSAQRTHSVPTLATRKPAAALPPVRKETRREAASSYLGRSADAWMRARRHLNTPVANEPDVEKRWRLLRQAWAVLSSPHSRFSTK